LVFVRTADDPDPLIAQGRWHGQIINSPQGEGGFGYDPIFYLPDLNCTAAELDKETKNRLSHRGIAASTLTRMLRDL
jgi:XTP/dITP diphosphohydrolase